MLQCLPLLDLAPENILKSSAYEYSQIVQRFFLYDLKFDEKIHVISFKVAKNVSGDKL